MTQAAPPLFIQFSGGWATVGGGCWERTALTRFAMVWTGWETPAAPSYVSSWVSWVLAQGDKRESVGAASGLLGRATTPGLVSALPKPAYRRRGLLASECRGWSSGCLWPSGHRGCVTWGHGEGCRDAVCPEGRDALRLRSGRSGPAGTIPPLHSASLRSGRDDRRSDGAFLLPSRSGPAAR